MIELIHTMKDIDQEEWNSLTGPDKVETMHQWFSFAEHVSFERKLRFCHVIYRDNNENIRGILPAYYQNTYLRDLVMSFGLLPLGRFVPAVKIPFQITQARVPFSVDFRYFGDTKYFYQCLSELERFSQEHHHSFVLIRDANHRLNLPGYLCMELYPEVYTEPYSSWDSYIESQRGKRGKHIRYEYKKSVDLGTKTYVQEDLEGYYTLLYRLQENVLKDHKSYLKYPPGYFKKIDQYLHQYTRCIFAETDGDIAGFLYLLENNDYITCKFAGRDYESPDPYVYFRLLYELIKYSIEKKKPVSIEKASYGAKLRRGFKLIDKWCYMKSNYFLLGDFYLALVRKANKRILKEIKRVKSFQT